ncbi:TPA_asm: P3 [Leucadendron betacytorhabdovirus 1]|nr:TPA_asm: P3 [Leucadendron betacytorhabdovirus 1]
MDKVVISKQGRVHKFNLRSDANGEDIVLKFPWSPMSSLIGHHHAGLESLTVEYTPYITTTRHGTYQVEIHDTREFFDTSKIRAQLLGETDIKCQVEFTGFDWAAKTEKSPYRLVFRSDLDALALDKTVGIFKITSRFKYSNQDPPAVTVNVKGVKRKRKGKYEPTLDSIKYQDDDGMGVLVDLRDKPVLSHN